MNTILISILTTVITIATVVVFSVKNRKKLDFLIENYLMEEENAIRKPLLDKAAHIEEQKHKLETDIQTMENIILRLKYSKNIIENDFLVQKDEIQKIFLKNLKRKKIKIEQEMVLNAFFHIVNEVEKEVHVSAP